MRGLIGILFLTLILNSGCTKTRVAEWSDEQDKFIFQISEFGQVDDNSFYIETSSAGPQSLTHSEQRLAKNEKGLVGINDINVDSRLKVYFESLLVSALPEKKYTLLFFLDSKKITVFKKIPADEQISAFEASLAKSRSELKILQQLQKFTQASEIKQKQIELQTLRQKQNIKDDLFLPFMQIPIKSFGTVEKIKNELGENTSKLHLKTSSWIQASHIELSLMRSDRILMTENLDIEPLLEEVYSPQKIDGMLTTSENLAKDFSIKTNIASTAKVYTQLETDGLYIYEVSDLKKANLTDPQKQQLQSGKSLNFQNCPVEILASLLPAERTECILIRRIIYPIRYVSLSLPSVDNDGSLASQLKLVDSRSSDNNKLIQISKNAVGQSIINNELFDPRTTLRVLDIKDKEFFYRRTLEDAPLTTAFMPGMSSSVKIIKFEMEENRLIVRQADHSLALKKGQNKNDFEELMSVPAKYLKRQFTDSSGNRYAQPRIVEASPAEADYVQLDWTQNSLSELDSPLSQYNMGQCFQAPANPEVLDVDMKLHEGILNFSLQYSVSMKLDNECIGFYQTYDDYNPFGNGVNTNARLKERVSFKFHDASSDKALDLAPEVPFSVQNQFGYGVWTLGQLKPSENGVYGREGSQSHKPILHDFRNGKVIEYTLAGLPEDDPERKQIYIDVTQEIVQSWNEAYRKAFAQTPYARNGEYIRLTIDEKNEVHLGDLNKNIIWFDNKKNDNHGVLGVSQLGANPRSGIIVADSLIIYAANIAAGVETTQRNTKNIQSWKNKLADHKNSIQKNLSKDSNSDLKKPEEKTQQSQEELTDEELDQLLGSNQIKSLLKNLSAERSAQPSVQNKDQENIEQQVAKVLSLKLLGKITQNNKLNKYEIENIIADQLLKKYSPQMNDQEKYRLSRLISLNKIRNQIGRLNAAKCFKTGHSLASSQNSLQIDFAQLPFNEALKKEIKATLAHEMGHSQGLTHNFIGSFDKKNFANQNYSSVMDYYSDGLLNFSGLGLYDIHAIRAAHTGLLENNNRNGFISLHDLKKTVANEGWTSFDIKKIKSQLHPYLFCTDIHVGDNPNCQRWDYGTTASEIVENAIQAHKDFYIHAYHGWDRLQFGYSEMATTLSYSLRQLIDMRPFMDELFYMLVTRQTNEESTVQDYFQAALKVYLYYHEILKTPSADVKFRSFERFYPVTYEYENSEKQKLKGFDLLEGKSLLPILANPQRIDTIGFEQDKSMSLTLLTLQGFPNWKYASANIEFSYLDFEKYLMGLDVTKNSLIMNNLYTVFTDSMYAALSNPEVTLHETDIKVDQSNEVRHSAGFAAIYNLESSVIQDKDNYAHLFKVGSSIGFGPSDRLRLSPLGSPEKSKVKQTFWALDNSELSQKMFKYGDKLFYFIKTKEQTLPLMENLFAAQLQQKLQNNANTEKEFNDSKIALLTALKKLNEHQQLVTDSEIAANESFSLENQVELLVSFTDLVMSIAQEVSDGKTTNAEMLKKDLLKNIQIFQEQLPLVAVMQHAMSNELDKISDTEKSAFLLALSEINNSLSKNDLEVKYGLLLKNIELLNQITALINPAYRR